MLEEIYEDNLIGDPNDLEEIIEQQGDELFDEADEEHETAGNAPAGDNENSNATRVEPKKRTVRNPRPKLDPERLKGPRGIAVIEDAFRGFKFHGKGYEKVDLDRVMKRLEHWAHRLYPRFQFDDCLDKIEKLGQKKPVQVYVKKIRMGLETVEEPVVLLDDMEETEVHNEAPIDAFDELLSQQLSQVRPENQTHAASSSQVTLLPDQPVVHQTTELTAEQRERMLRNKLIAEERRLSRMKGGHDIQRAAEVELSTLDTVPTKPSAAILLSNNESTASSELTSEINTYGTEATNAEEASIPSTSAVFSTHTTSENEETSLFCKAVEYEGTNIVVGPVNKEEDNIFKLMKLGDITVSSRLVDAEETSVFPSVSYAPVNTQHTDTALMSVDTEEVNTSSGPVVVKETNETCMTDDSEQTCTSTVPVQSEETNVTSMSVDTEDTETTSVFVNVNHNDATSVAVDTENSISSL